MIIQNFKQLATTSSRKNALEIINAGIEAVLTKPAMLKQITISKNILKIDNLKWNLANYKRIFIIGAGKASGEMAETLEKILGNKITRGIVIDTKEKKLSKIEVVKGTHPLTSQQNINAAKKILSIADESEKDDLIIALISGGGSALMESPRISLPEYINLNKMLLQKGATIEEINTIRKHLSMIKGGQLAQRAKPATLITLIVSDVLTNNLSVIASGPTVKDSTTISDAKKIQKKYNLPSLPFIETPKENFPNVANILLITNSLAVEAMKIKAAQLGYKTKIITTKLQGEARDVGKKLAAMIKPKTAIIAAGETTVTVKGNGKGGRNQELAVAASENLKNGVVVSCSTDGVDFITEAAGGIVDDKTKEIAKKINLDSNKFLKNNDSYNFLKKVNGIIATGKTGTNVSDIFLVLGNQ